MPVSGSSVPPHASIYLIQNVTLGKHSFSKKDGKDLNHLFFHPISQPTGLTLVCVPTMCLLLGQGIELQE